MITVKSTLAPGLVALWERHPNQPGGEVFIADNETHQVAETVAVRAALGRGVLVEVAPEMVVKETPPAGLPELRPPAPTQPARRPRKRGK